MKKILIVEDQFIEANDLRLILEKAGYTVCGIAKSFHQAIELKEKNRPDFALLDIFLKGELTGIDLAKVLSEDNIPFIFLSANCNLEVLEAAKLTQPYGFLVKPFREKDVLIALDIANYRHQNSNDASLRQQAILEKQVLEVVEQGMDLEHSMLKITQILQSYVPFDYLGTGFSGQNKSLENYLSFFRIGFHDYQILGEDELITVTGIHKKDLEFYFANAPIVTSPTVYTQEELRIESMRPSIIKLISTHFKMSAHMTLPIPLVDGRVFYLHFYSKIKKAYSIEHLSLIEKLSPCLNRAVNDIAVKSYIPYRTISPRKEFAKATKTNSNPVFENIIGRSHLLLNVFDHITQVAPLNTSVLILGESGTGKEKIAESIHNSSPRRNSAMVSVNCAGLPPTLIESELFGHEKGAFTGASEKRIGKFEQADTGTIFLDEIGEMPMELQVKLLRVLQERQIERVGARSSISVDIRVIAATNRNLEKEVAEGRFRLDLYYRLNVFPITLPPLRDRLEDISELSAFFLQKMNTKTGKDITGISPEAIQKMTNYHWPGNIRELEHVIERSVILCKGDVITDVDFAFIPAIAQKSSSQQFPSASNVPAAHELKSLREHEKDYLVEVLRQCKGKVSGKYGAAAILGIPATTLQSKLKKLGVEKENF